MAIQDTLPDRLGPYRLLDRIGEGGMGVVHRAADSENRLVAIKVLRPQTAGDAIARQRLAREVETMRRVRSPFVAEIIDADVTGDVPYIVTRFVPGSTLEQVVGEHGPLRGARLQRLAYGLAGALCAVHAAGVVHRDLKPGNVLIVGDDPVVIDFGIAQAGDATRITQTGMFMGTPGYLAPEVIEGQPSAPASDVHSWGATVAFAARGEPPYGTGPYEAVFFRILQGNANLDGIHGALCPLIAAAMAREPMQRPTASWLADHVAGLDLTAPRAATTASATKDVANLGPAVTRSAPTDHTVPSIAPGAASANGKLLAGAAAAGGTAAGGTAAGGTAPAGSVAAGGPPAAGLTAAVDHAMRYQRPRDVADLLPPVRYAPSSEGARRRRPQAERARTAMAARVADAPRQPSARRTHRLLGLAALVIAVAMSLVLPVAGTVAVLAVIAVLRAADRAQRRLAVRRIARGPRAIDPLLVVASAPWALARSVLVTVLLAPPLMLIAGVAAVAAIIAMGSSQLPLAAAYAAGVFMALNCVGPGSRAPRRELNRVFGAIAPTRLAAAAVTLMLGFFAAALVSLALLKAPTFWPVPDPASLLAHLPGASLVSRTLAHPPGAGLLPHLDHPPGAGLVRHLAHPPGGGLVHRSIAFLRHVGHGLAGRIQVL